MQITRKCRMEGSPVICVVYLSLLVLISSVWSAPPLLPASNNCSSVLAAIEGLGAPKGTFKGTPSGLRICGAGSDGGSGCCTAAIESRMLETSHQFVERQTRDTIGKLASVLGNRAQKFNEYFKELLAESKKEFHAMFKRTYGAIYEQNSYVFSDLFTELESYYSRGKVDLSEAMDQFFNTLYQKMFTVLNSQFTFDDKYLGCVSEHMKQLKPFGDVPDKLSVQIKRSFVATRTYAQALVAASDVVKNAMNVKPNLECAIAVTRMRNCSLCATGTQYRPCPNFCADTMQSCMHNFVELEMEWNNYVASIDKVSERLLGPFNVVMVVEPINIKISEAIMNFQERNKEISGQVFQGCGRPILGKRKRSIDDDFLFLDGGEEEGDVAESRVRRSADPEPNKEIRDFEPVRFSGENYGNNERLEGQGGRAATGGGGDGGGGRKNRGRGNKNRNGGGMDYDMGKEPTLDKLIKDIRQKVKDTKKFWSNLPFQFCNHEDLVIRSTFTNGGDQQMCWNGQSAISVDSAISSRSSGDSKPPPPKRNAILEAQLYSLRTSVNQLRNAYNGHDVEWADQDENEFGSGAGSGGGYDDEDTGDTGDVGSGMGGVTDYDPAFGRSGSTSYPSSTSGDLDSGVSVSLPSSSSTARPMHEETEDRTEGGSSSSRPDDRVTLGGGEERVTQGPKGGMGPTQGTESSSGSTGAPQMSITRAVVTYFFPIFMAWFGGIFSILL